MIYIEKMYGGLCNNLLQINNALHFLKNNSIPYSYLKIVNKYEKRYNPKKTKFQGKSLIYRNISDFFIDKLPDIVYNRFIHIRYIKKFKDKIDLTKDYVLEHAFTYDCKLLYDFLCIKSLQNYILDTYKCYFDTFNVCIHIRRGDFLKYRLNSILKKSEIVNIIENNLDKNIILLSDDKEYLYKNFSNYKNIKIVSDLDVDIEFLIGTTCHRIYGTKGSTFSMLLNVFSNYFHNP